MLSWSGQDDGSEIDLAALGRGEPGAQLELGVALHRFASAAAGDDGAELGSARAALVAEAEFRGSDGCAVMIDAAAVVANFEMMTRLADGTGARFPVEVAAARAPISTAFRLDDAPSRR